MEKIIFKGKKSDGSLFEYELPKEFFDEDHYNYHELVLYKKDIISIDLAPLTSIKHLKTVYLFSNRLKKLDLSPLNHKELEKIRLDGNNFDQLDLLPLKNCPKLNNLDLSKNKLSFIDLSPLASCRYLKYLNLSSNALKKIDLSPLYNTDLEELHLDGNNFDELNLQPLNKCPKLNVLVISNTTVDLSPLRKCDSLELSISHSLPISRFLVYTEAEIEEMTNIYESSHLKDFIVEIQAHCRSMSRFEITNDLEQWDLKIEFYDTIDEFGNNIRIEIFHKEFESSIFNVYSSDYWKFTRPSLPESILDHFGFNQDWRWYNRYGHPLIGEDQEKEEYSFTKFLKELNYWQNDDLIIQKNGFFHLLCLDHLDFDYLMGRIILKFDKTSIEMYNKDMEFFDEFYELSHTKFLDLLENYCKGSKLDMNGLMEIMFECSKKFEKICELEVYEDFCSNFGSILWDNGYKINRPTCESCEKEIESEDELNTCDECGCEFCESCFEEHSCDEYNC